jgi:putative N-acetyltransferase (TIGR04045 family)
MSFEAILGDWIPAANTLTSWATPPSEYWIKPAVEAWEFAGARALRHAVFCDEQGLFSAHDRDAIDDNCTVLVALSCMFGMPDQVVGTVRIHQHRPGQWQGSRLAVDGHVRRLAALGTALIQLAVCSAHAQHARRFTAQVQLRNVTLFQRLHWQVLESVMVQGQPHALMQANLSHYPARQARPRVLSSQARAA